MTTGVTRVYLKHNCGKTTIIQIDPAHNIREIVEDELELATKQHDADCGMCCVVSTGALL